MGGMAEGAWVGLGDNVCGPHLERCDYLGGRANCGPNKVFTRWGEWAGVRGCIFSPEFAAAYGEWEVYDASMDLACELLDALGAPLWRPGKQQTLLDRIDAWTR